VGTYRYGISRPLEFPITARYKHFSGTEEAEGATGSPQDGEDFPYVYDSGAGLFEWGTPGGGVSAQPWLLWPLKPSGVDACTGYDAQSGANDFNCFSNGYAGSSVGCSSTHIWPNPGSSSKRYCTKAQEQLMQTGTIPPKICESELVAMDVGYRYKWLDKISSYNQKRYFDHWIFNPKTQSLQKVTGRHLAETLVCVMGREKWWYLDSATSLPSGNPGSCSIPQRWAFGCSKTPLFSHSIMWTYAKPLNSILGRGGNETLLIKIYKGETLTPAETNALETVGILNLQDWGRPEGEPNKQLLSFFSNPIGKGRLTTVEEYFFAQPGGWTWECSGSTNNRARWPQIARYSSSFFPFCRQIFNWMPFSDCMTAAPLPSSQSPTCYTVDTCNGVGPCDGHGWPPAGCGFGPTGLCSWVHDSIAAECNGLLFSWGRYGCGAIVNNQQTFKCVEENEATLCRVPPGGTTCTLDLPKLRSAQGHYIPEVISQSIRNGISDITLACCGGSGLYDCFNATCPAKSPNSQGCQIP
tara:strand:+ start:11109 stop:12683 length:1575 start_codon:yes stop_codon:yes gene_type:complete